MRALILTLLALGCASRSKEAPAPGATAVASSLPSNAAPERPSTPEAGKASAPQAPPAASGAPAAPPSGPMTAAEAAAAARQGAAGDAASDDAPCASDDECASTMVAAGACCPMLCTPRAVTKKAADAILARTPECTGGKPCPLPQCAPPRFQTLPACERGKCVAKIVAPQ